ncbi:MAG: phenylalanine--tRNA ligase subunit beta, partial [Bacteroidales bacterium]|nr:phenylalanine--tRNA ligase subunit beta [Bacteroidales bacterium]
KPILYQEVSKFPEVRRDLALLVDQHITFAEIEKLAYNTEKNYLQSVNLFDVYEGDKLPEGKKSYAVSFILQDFEKTLSEKQITGVMEKMMRQMTEKLGAVIR